MAQSMHGNTIERRLELERIHSLIITPKHDFSPNYKPVFQTQIRLGGTEGLYLCKSNYTIAKRLQRGRLPVAANHPNTNAETPKRADAHT